MKTSTGKAAPVTKDQTRGAAVKPDWAAALQQHAALVKAMSKGRQGR